MPYVYVTSLQRYRDADSGRFVPDEDVRAYTLRLIDAGGNTADTLSDLYSSGALSSDDYIASLRAELKSSMIQEMTLGRGGRGSMTARDWGAVGGLLSKQYAYLPGFKAALDAGELSPAEIRNRARLYFEATGEAYERGNAAAHGVYGLPAYPRDGSSCCQNRDGCHWEYETLLGDGNLNVSWVLDPSIENCPVCVRRAETWSPLEIRGGLFRAFVDIRVTDPQSDC